MGKLRLRGGRDLAKATRPKAGLLSAWPAPPTAFQHMWRQLSTDRQLAVAFPGSLQTAGSCPESEPFHVSAELPAVTPGVKAVASLPSTHLPGSQPFVSDGRRDFLLFTGLQLPHAMVAGPGPALPEQRPQNNLGPSPLGRNCLPRKWRP